MEKHFRNDKLNAITSSGVLTCGVAFCGTGSKLGQLDFSLAVSMNEFHSVESKHSKHEKSEFRDPLAQNKSSKT